MAKGEGIGDRIAQAVREAGMKPAGLARALKVSQATVHHWIHGGHGITWKNVRRVATATNTTPGWLMFGTDHEAERVSQTVEELAFLRLFRELDDQSQASALKYLTVLPRGRFDPPE